MYHRITDERFDPWGLAVAPANFADQLAWLASNRTILSLPEFAARHRDGSLPENATALTFDDGYACNARSAAPLLEQKQIPATIFLPVELIERGEPFWWDELQRIALDFDGEALRVGSAVVVLGEKRAGDGEWKPGAPPRTPRQQAFERIWAILRPLKPKEVDRAMAQLRAQAAVAEGPFGAIRPMTPQLVRETASANVEFGAHALTHPWLTTLNAAEKSVEIGESMARCTALTGSRPRTFAYPYGNFDDESARLVQQAGFECACATGSAAVTAKSPLYALPRMHVGNWESRRFARAVAGLA